MKHILHKGLRPLLSLALALLLPLSGLAAAMVTPEAAVQAALTHANLGEKDAVILRVKLDSDHGSVQYEVEFSAGNREYDYEIDAITGAVLGFDTEAETALRPAADAAGLIGEEKALAAALAHAQLLESDVTLVLVQLQRDDGRWEYEIEFRQGTMEYDYELDALTGEILSFDQDMESNFRPDGTSSATVASGKPDGTASATVASGKPDGSPSPTVASGKPVTKEQAVDIALAHAGFQRQDVRKLEAERDRDNGLTVYEVEFQVGRKEYSYDINAETGAIVKHSIDND